MFRTPALFFLLLLLAATFAAPPAAADVFAARFPDAALLEDETIEYGESRYARGQLPAKFEQGPAETLEGRIRYSLQRMPAGRSVLEVFRAYERAAKADGFAELFGCRAVSGCGGSIPYLMNKSKAWLSVPFSDDFAYSLMEKSAAGGREVLAILAVTAGGSSPERAAPRVYLERVSTDAVEAEVEILSSGEIADQIAATGAASIYGLQFELNSADLLPASAEVVRQIALYLQQNPEQGVYLVGHTDSQGGFDHNMDLSRRRADSVRAALVADFGISPRRLEAHGVGLLAPKASNEVPEGQARNRRVEVIPF
ncbi:MAG: OmpA family protein [Acidobacteriota bacterium]